MKGSPCVLWDVNLNCACLQYIWNDISGNSDVPEWVYGIKTSCWTPAVTLDLHMCDKHPSLSFCAEIQSWASVSPPSIIIGSNCREKKPGVGWANNLLTPSLQGVQTGLAHSVQKRGSLLNIFYIACKILTIFIFILLVFVSCSELLIGEMGRI